MEVPPEVTFALAEAALCLASAVFSPERRHTSTEAKKRGSRAGKKTRPRKRRTVTEIYNCLGPIYFRRSYRMTFETFWHLHDTLQSGIKHQAEQFAKVRNEKRKKERAADTTSTKKSRRNTFATKYFHNGPIHTTTRLACALRYFAGASPYDLMSNYGLSYNAVMDSIWCVVEAINQHRDFDIEYPSQYSQQEEIAAEFCRNSRVQFNNCAGAIDGMLVWIHKPSEIDEGRTETDAKKFFCGRKHKFGLNLQAVSDCRGRILDMSITFGGASSDCIAFEASDLWNRLERGLLKPGLVLFGDNAYLNTAYMATPYTNVANGPKDNYNFYHSQVSLQSFSCIHYFNLQTLHNSLSNQLRIRVECCFGMLVARWGILRSIIPQRVSVHKTIALVAALSKLHNFCIDSTNDQSFNVSPHPGDATNLRSRSAAVDSTVVELHATEDGSQLPSELLHAGHHNDDFPRSLVRRHNRRTDLPPVLPRELLCQHVLESGAVRPQARRHHPM